MKIPYADRGLAGFCLSVDDGSGRSERLLGWFGGGHDGACSAAWQLVALAEFIVSRLHI
jgi:hypothetical protein